MNKDAIKIIKRNKKDEAEKTGAAVPETRKTESDARRGNVNAVKNWISERHENSRAEKVFSDNKISDWKIMSKNFD